MGEAIEATYDLYPGILETNPNLLFMLKCRQFVEMVSGTEGEVHAAAKTSNCSPSSPSHFVPNPAPALSSPRSSTCTPPTPSSSSSHDQPHNSHLVTPHSHGDAPYLHIISPLPSKSGASRSPSVSPKTSPRERNNDSHMNSRNAAMNGQSWSSGGKLTSHASSEERMDTGDSGDCSNNRELVNGASMNGVNNHHSKSVHHCDMGEY